MRGGPSSCHGYWPHLFRSARRQGPLHHPDWLSLVSRPQPDFRCPSGAGSATVSTGVDPSQSRLRQPPAGGSSCSSQPQQFTPFKISPRGLGQTTSIGKVPGRSRCSQLPPKIEKTKNRLKFWQLRLMDAVDQALGSGVSQLSLPVRSPDPQPGKSRSRRWATVELRLVSPRNRDSLAPPSSPPPPDICLTRRRSSRGSASPPDSDSDNALPPCLRIRDR